MARLLALAVLAAVALFGCSSSPAEVAPVDASPSHHDATAAADARAPKPDARTPRGDGGDSATHPHDATTDARDASSHARDATADVHDAATDALTDARDATSDARDATSDARDATVPPHDAAPDAHDGGKDARDSAADGRDAGPDARDAAMDVGVDAYAGPTLLSLTVSPLTLYPAFSPDTFDYYVRCAAGDNDLTVSVTAPTGGAAQILQPVLSASAVQQTVPLDVLENQAIVALVTQGYESTEYWVRCLPPDFPVLDFELHREAGAPTPGYYLLGDIFHAAGETGYGMVLDRNGVPVWYARTINGVGPKTVQPLADDTISFIPVAGYTFGTYEGSWELHTLDPVGVHYITSVGMPVDSHELRQMPNGDFLVIAVPILAGQNLSGINNFGADADVIDCVIQELTPDGGVVWQWTGSDHVAPTEMLLVSTAAATTLDGGSVTVVDPYHCNSIDWDSAGNLLVSMRNVDALMLVSKATGKLLWKLGGTTTNRDNAPHITMENDPDNGFWGQHHARFLPDGTISVYDDETARPHPARGLVLAYDADAGTASVVWQYAGTSNIPAMGSFTVLADGSHVIGWGNTNHILTETNEQGVDLLDLACPDGDESYRAIKVPLSALNIDTLRQSVGPWSSSTGVVDAGVDAADAALDAGRDASSDAHADGG